MEIILAAVIILIVVAIVALLIFKKKQQALDDEPVVPTQVLQKTQASSDTFDDFTRADSKPELDPLEKADRLINDNRHDEAINELKRLLLSNPKNSVAILKLLQVYVLTNNFSAFDKLHQKLKETGDAAALEQAETYRLLLDDATAEEPAPVAEKETKIDTLEFDVGTSQPTHHDVAPVISTTVQAPESLSDFEDFNFDSSPNNTVAKTDDETFDLNLDTLSTDTLSFDTPQKTTDDTPTLDLGGDLSFDTLGTSTTDDNTFDLNDFGLDTPASTTPAVSEPSLDSSFDLDFNLDSPSLETPKSETPTLETKSPALTDEFALDGFDLSPATPAPKPDATGNSLDFGDLDFGLESNTKTETTNTDFSLDNTGLGLETNDFGLELDGLDTTVAPSDELANFSLDPIPASTTPSKEEFALDGFDLEIGTPSLDTPNLDVPSLETNSLDTSTTTNDSFDLGDLSFDTPTLETPKPTAPTSLEADSGFDFDITMGDSKPADITPPVVAKHTDEELDGFGFDLSSLTKEETVAPSLEKEEPVTGFDFLTTPSTPKRELTSSFDLSDLVPAPASTPAFDTSMTAGLDTSGITLDLAQQYVALGEYDSAKHLLEEVVNTGNAEQSRTASSLLKRLG